MTTPASDHGTRGLDGLAGRHGTLVNNLTYQPGPFQPQVPTPIQETNSVGGYVATHVYGWTEFNIDRDSKALTITTYGIPPYTYNQLQANTAAVVGPQPAVWQTCSVQQVIGADSGRSCDIGEDDEGDHEH